VSERKIERMRFCVKDILLALLLLISASLLSDCQMYASVWQL
jgi:hypothetical protein